MYSSRHTCKCKVKGIHETCITGLKYSIFNIFIYVADKLCYAEIPPVAHHICIHN